MISNTDPAPNSADLFQYFFESKYVYKLISKRSSLMPISSMGHQDS